jgi:hypothetical protein
MRHESTGSWQGGSTALLRPQSLGIRGIEAPLLVDSLLQGLAVTAAAFVVAGGLTLVVRRFAGAIPGAASPAVLLVTALCGAALVLVVDATARQRRGRGLAMLARCGLAAGAAGLLVPSRAETPLEWATVLAAAVVLGGVIIRDPHPRTRRGLPWATGRVRDPRSPIPGSTPATAATLPKPAVSMRRRHDPDPAIAGLVRQRFERLEAADGTDTLIGALNITVPLGAKLASGHVGFCPSFRELPAVDVTTEYDGVEAVVSVGELVPWGVRIDCRLAEAAEEDLDIPVILTARVKG